LVDADGLKVLVCDGKNCAEYSDEIAKRYLWNKNFQKAQGFHLDGNNIIDNATGAVRGTWLNLGDDGWSSDNAAIVRGVTQLTSDPTMWAAGLVRGYTRYIRPIKPINLPAAKKVTVDMEEVVSGHTSTGKRFLQGVQEANSKRWKDIFPDSMSAKQIEGAIKDAYGHSRIIKVQGDRIQLRGYTKDGMVVEMWYNKVDRLIETAYPTGFDK
jgi:hypothetical protein